MIAIINLSSHKAIALLKSRYSILKHFRIKVLASLTSSRLYAMSSFRKFGHEFKMQLIDLSVIQRASANETLANHDNFLRFQRFIANISAVRNI